MELAITRLELLFLQEERVVEKGQRIEDVKVFFLGQDEHIVDQVLQTLLESVLQILGLDLGLLWCLEC